MTGQIEHAHVEALNLAEKQLTDYVLQQLTTRMELRDGQLVIRFEWELASRPK